MRPNHNRGDAARNELRVALRVPLGRYGAAMTGWQYSAPQWDPTRDGDEELWARAIAADGWRTWLDHTGTWTDINGRRVRVWSLRRPCRRPFSVHEHTKTCVDSLLAGPH